MRASALPLAALVLAAAGCGGGTAAPTQSGLDGRTLFVQQCGGCHTLADAGTHGSFGAALDQVRPTRAAVLRAITRGTGDMEPVPLGRHDADAVAAYVARAVRR